MKTELPQFQTTTPRGSPYVLLAVLVLAAILRLKLAVGIQDPDSVLYIAPAHALATGHYTVPTTAYAVRYGLIAPMAVSITVFGLNDFALCLYPLFCSLVTVAVAYAVGTRVGGRRTGLVAAALLAVLPLDVIQATDLHADVPMSMWLALVLLCFTLGRDATPAGRRRYGVLAGACFGFAYLTKLTTLAFFPAFVGLALCSRPRTGAIWAVGMFVLILVVETTLYIVLAGSATHRYEAETAGGHHAAQIHRLYPEAPRNIRLAFTEIPDTLFRPWPLTPTPYSGLHFLILPVAVVWVIRARNATYYPLLVWIVGLYVPLSFGTFDFKTFAPAQIRGPRILEPLFLPAVVLIGGYLMAVRRRSRAASALAVITVAGVVSAAILSFDVRQELAPVQKVVHEAKARAPHPDAVLYCDPWIVQYVRYLDRYAEPSQVREYPLEKSPGYILVNRPTIDGLRRANGYRPPDWVMELDTATREIVAVAHCLEQVRGGYRQRMREGLPLFDVFWAVQKSDGREAIVYYIPSELP